MTDRYVPLSTYSSAITVIAGMGLNFDAVADMAGLPAGLLSDPKALITARQFHELAAFGHSLVNNDPAFALNVADLVRLEMIDVLGPLFATTPTVRSFLNDALRLSLLVDPCVDNLIEIDRDEVRGVCHVLEEQGADSRFFHAEANFAVASRLLRSVFRRPDLVPLRVEMQHDGSAWLDAYRRHFGEGVTFLFNQPRNLVAFPVAWLDIANPGHSPSVHARMQALAAARLAALPVVESFAARVLQLLERESGRRVLDLDDVAGMLDTTARTLQRRLGEENTSFQKLRDGLRFRQATALLSEAGADIPTIAATLGFSEPATFQRAFKAWSGESPAEFRRRRGLPG